MPDSGLEKIRVLIVDDSVAMRRIVSDVLSADPMLEVVATTPNGPLALERLAKVKPDLVVLDMEMPALNGLATLELIRRSWPKLPVIMFSSLTRRCASATLDALALGANDYVSKPDCSEGPEAAVERVRDELVQKIKLFCPSRAGQKTSRVVPPVAPALSLPVFDAHRRTASDGRIDLLVVATSTGGPNALVTLMSALPADFPVPVAIVQHMPPLFTGILAERLNARSPLTIREATEGDMLLPGQALIAPGGYHMTVSRGFPYANVGLNLGPQENSCRPAADVLFRTAAAIFGPGVLAVVMTGMGQDGLRGCEEIHRRGGCIYVQDEESSIVWGMPGAIARAGLAKKVLPLDALAAEVAARVGPPGQISRTLPSGAASQSTDSKKRA
jgi:two-component system, chemotaxis family, protein-glutamate methylesterase/glutaminase